MQLTEPGRQQKKKNRKEALLSAGEAQKAKFRRSPRLEKGAFFFSTPTVINRDFKLLHPVKPTPPWEWLKAWLKRLKSVIKH